MIREKAVIIAKELNIENIQASDGWLRRWKEKKWYIIQDCFEGVEICPTRDG